MATLTYRVGGMSCAHCKAAVEREVGRLPSVTAVDVDLAGARVDVHGEALDDAAIRAAIDDAGYDAEAA